MKSRQIILNTLVVLIALLPVVYLLVTWASVPEIIITHFNFNQPTDKVESRQTLLYVTIGLSLTTALVYLLLRNLKRIDPKVKRDTPVSGFNRLALSLTVFLVLLNYFLILGAVHRWDISQKEMFIFLGLLLAVLGNYLHTIKPNYFAGIRLPWTLNDENNWRLTHRLAGKLLFAGGIVLALICWFLPGDWLRPVFTGTVVLLLLVPCIYSYRLYKNKQ